MSGEGDETAHRAEHELHTALIAVKRNALVALRDAHRIDDAVLRRVQATLDAEEVRLDLRAAAKRVSPGQVTHSADESADGRQSGGRERHESHQHDRREPQERQDRQDGRGRRDD